MDLRTANQLLRLTPRELEVLRGLAAGGTSASIGKELFIVPETVRATSARAMKKIGAKTRIEAVVIAVRAGLIE